MSQEVQRKFISKAPFYIKCHKVHIQVHIQARWEARQYMEAYTWHLKLSCFQLTLCLWRLLQGQRPQRLNKVMGLGVEHWWWLMSSTCYQKGRGHMTDCPQRGRIWKQKPSSFPRSNWVSHTLSLLQVHFRSIFIVNAFNFTLNSLERTQNNLPLWTNLTFFVHSFTITLSVIWSSVRLMNVSHSLFQLWFWSPSAADVSLSSLVIKCITAVTSALLTVSVYCLLLGRYCHSGFKSFFCAENSLNWCHESTKVVPVKVWA